MARVRSVAGLIGRNPDFARLYLALLLAFTADWFATVALVGLVLGLVMLTSSVPTLVATWLAVAAGPVVAIYVMLGCMLVAAAGWVAFTRQLHRGLSPVDPAPGP